MGRAVASMPARKRPQPGPTHDFFTADTWDESRRILEEQPDLLSDEADALLGQGIDAARDVGAQGTAPNEDVQRFIRTLEQHRTLLRRCRAVGVDEAFAEAAAAGVSSGGHAAGLAQPAYVPHQSGHRPARQGGGAGTSSPQTQSVWPSSCSNLTLSALSGHFDIFNE